ncbi:MAG: hypothetical protein NXY57DRAFT_361648 [Lentinula lateritia]|nr:MAG: hypothetical protein NXY57DRAFT_361648 [Lentinula lateritia]
MITVMHSNENPSSPMPSPIRRHSVHRPLRSSPLAGPALSSEGLVIPDEDVQRRCKPNRISSSPEIPSTSSPSIYPADIDHLPLPAITTRPRLHQRNSSPNYLTVPSVSLTKSPSAPSLHMPSTPPSFSTSPKPSLRPLYIQSNTSPISTVPPSAPVGDWLVTNTYAETPRFSRLNMGSNVVMPVPAKEYRRKSIASVRSISNISGHASSPPGLVRSPSGSSGVRSEEVASTFSETLRRVDSRKSLSSLAGKVRRRASTLLSIKSDSSEGKSIESAPSLLQSSSVTSLSSVADNSDNDFLLSPSLPPRSPRSARSRGSSKSDCTIIDEEAEDDILVTPAPPEKTKEHKRGTFLLKFRRIVGAHRLMRPRVSDVS